MKKKIFSTLIFLISTHKESNKLAIYLYRLSTRKSMQKQQEIIRRGYIKIQIKQKGLSYPDFTQFIKHIESLRATFFAFIAVYGISFAIFSNSVRRLNRYYKLFCKFNVNWSSITLAQNLMKFLLLVLLGYIMINLFNGIYISKNISEGVNSLTCSLAAFPNNFGKVNIQQKRLYKFNDYQDELMSLRQMFNQVKYRIIDLQQINNDRNFMNKTDEYIQILGELNMNGSNFLKNIKQSIQKLVLIKMDSKLMGGSINYLRELLYWIKGSIIFTQNYIYSIYRIQNIPKLFQSINNQIYLILILSVGISLLLIIYMNLKDINKNIKILKYIHFLLFFSTIFCIILSSIHQFLLLVPTQICNILATYPNKGKLIDIFTTNVHFYEEEVRQTLIQLFQKSSLQSQGNMALMNTKIYQQIDRLQYIYKQIYQYKYNSLELTLKQLNQKEQLQIKQYFTHIPVYLSNLQEVNLILTQIVQNINKDGNFGKFSVRSLGYYFQSIQKSICDINMPIWFDNSFKLFYCGFVLNVSLLILGLYMRSKLKDYSINESEQQGGVQLQIFSTQKMNDN